MAPRRKAAAPVLVTPALATRVSHVPEGADWVHEPKLDGYRMQCQISGTRAVLLSRNGLDWSERFPNVKAAALGLRAADGTVLDGEVVAVARRGESPFQALQTALTQGAATNVIYWVFDLLASGGRDLRGLPLDERRAQLETLLNSVHRTSPIRLTKRCAGTPSSLLAKACARGEEGVISKRRDARYPTGRSQDWLKIKCGERDELVIIGFSPPAGSREHFGALLLAIHPLPGAPLRYAGRVGSGFSAASLEALVRLLEPIERDTPACTVPHDMTRGVRWVEPLLVAEVSFAEWTTDHLLRQATFLGLRQDKEAADVKKEMPAGDDTTGSAVQGVTISHGSRVVFKSVGVTKHDLAVYYEAVSSLMLPHITSRPLSTLRCPDGPGVACFFQKHWSASNAPHVKVMAVSEANGDSKEYAVARRAVDLIRLVQLNVIEFHPWASGGRSLELPDRLILDLDPGPGISWSVLRDSAVHVRDVLQGIGLRSWVKLSGGKGVHITLPLERRLDWNQFADFARILASRLVADNPGTFIDTAAKAARKRRIFVDWLRNVRGATAAAPWSVRARENAPVAVPLLWEELRSIDSASEMILPVVMEHLSAKPDDPWADMNATKQRVSSRVLASLADYQTLHR